MKKTMAAANPAGNGEQKTVEELLCSTELPDGLHGQLTFIAVFNAFLSVTAFLGNTLILIALHKESSLHPPSKLLLRCLATTDLSLLPNRCLWSMNSRIFVSTWML